MSYPQQPVPTVGSQPQPTHAPAFFDIAPEVYFLWYFRPMNFELCPNPKPSKVNMRVIFWGNSRPERAPGFWCAATSVAFNRTPSCTELQGTISHWARCLQVEHPVHARQSTIHIVDDLPSVVMAVSERGPVPPDPPILNESIRLDANLAPTTFEQKMKIIAQSGKGAFLVVNPTAYEECWSGHGQRCSSDNIPNPSVIDVSNSGEARTEDGDVF